MSEMAQTADHLIVIGRGELIADTSVTEFIQRATVSNVRVRSPEGSRLRDLIAGPDVTVSSDEIGVLTVTGMTSDQVGTIAAEGGIILYELVPQASLEEAFLQLTQDTVEYRAPETSAELADAGRNPA
jgi:ABC-2 type transport system ATP-binding protein